jgi:hypothetical protein
MSYILDPIMVDDTLRIKQKFNWNTFIETGTDKGDSVRVLLKLFDKIYTCEIESERWKHYDDILQNENVTILNGSSTECLPKFFLEIGHGNFFLYLDAHWNGNWPILDELRLVAEWGYKPVIIIHDFENELGFGFDRYRPEGQREEYLLNFDYVKESIETIYGKDGYVFETNKESLNPIKIGCAYFYPKQ